MARRSWEYSRESYQAGSVDHLLMLDAERTYQRNLDEQHNVDRLRYRALASQFASLGGGLQTEGPLPGKGERPSAQADASAGFAVEIGRAGSRQEAAAQAETWKDKGYGAYVMPMTDDEGLPDYAVVFGRLASEDQAAMMAQAFNQQEGRPARSVRVVPSPDTGGTWTEEIDGQKIVDGHGPDKDDHDTGKGHSDHGDLDMDHIDKLQW